MSKRGENIRKRQDGRWEGRYIYERTIDGKAKYRSVYAHTYTDVRRRLNEAKAGFAASECSRSSAKTFGYAAEQWLTGCSLRLKHSTVVKYSTLLNMHLLPRFKNTSVALISGDSVAEFIIEKSSELSNSTIRSLLTTIKSILKYAEKQGWHNNPLIDLRLPSEQGKEVSALSIEEYRKLENFLMTDTDEGKLGLYLCLYTGLRIGELCALRWGDVDLKKRTLSITSTIQRIKRKESYSNKKTMLWISTPKSYSSIRVIPLPPRLIELLQVFYRSDNCFLLSGTNSPVEPRTMQYRFGKYARQLGLSYTNTHVLRHTFATRCVEVGFDPKTLSEVLGHSRVEITLNRYVHSSDEHKRDQMALLFESGQKSGQDNRQML